MSDSTVFPDRTRTTDEIMWLEEISGERPLEWVAVRNTVTAEELGSARMKQLQAEILEVLDSPARIPFVSKHGDRYYNFWRDAEHPKGLWRRTTLERYRTADPEWEVLLDLDELARIEGTAWVFESADLLFPDNSRALLRLSPDGGDTSVVREFDLAKRAFVED